MDPSLLRATRVLRRITCLQPSPSLSEEGCDHWDLVLPFAVFSKEVPSLGCHQSLEQSPTGTSPSAGDHCQAPGTPHLIDVNSTLLGVRPHPDSHAQPAPHAHLPSLGAASSQPSAQGLPNKGADLRPRNGCGNGALHQTSLLAWAQGLRSCAGPAWGHSRPLRTGGQRTACPRGVFC